MNSKVEGMDENHGLRLLFGLEIGGKWNFRALELRLKCVLEAKERRSPFPASTPELYTTQNPSQSCLI
jgi:hypothetical protein